MSFGLLCSSCALLCVATLFQFHCKPQLATKSISPNLWFANQKAVSGGYRNYLDRSKNSQQDSPTLVANQSSKVSLKWPLLCLLSFRMIMKSSPFNFIFQDVTVQFFIDFETKMDDFFNGVQDHFFYDNWGNYPIWIFNQCCPIDVFWDPSEYTLNF